MEKKSKLSTSKEAAMSQDESAVITHSVQILDAGGTLSDVQEFAAKVKKAGFQATIRQIGKQHCVLVGGFSQEEGAKAYIRKVTDAGFKAELVKY